MTHPAHPAIYSQLDSLRWIETHRRDLEAARLRHSPADARRAAMSAATHRPPGSRRRLAGPVGPVDRALGNGRELPGDRHPGGTGRQAAETAGSEERQSRALAAGNGPA